jgi:hypothetical protein
MSDRMELLRKNHQDPVNLAMHAAGFLLIARALGRLFRGRVLAALVLTAAGLGLLVGGHRLEGSDPFSVFREG